MLTLNQGLDIVVLVQRKICEGDGDLRWRGREEKLEDCIVVKQWLLSRWTSASSDKIAFDIYIFCSFLFTIFSLSTEHFRHGSVYTEHTHTHMPALSPSDTARLQKGPLASLVSGKVWVPRYTFATASPHFLSKPISWTISFFSNERGQVRMGASRKAPEMVLFSYWTSVEMPHILVGGGSQFWRDGGKNNCVFFFFF